MLRVALEPAYILHARAYRETSLLIYALTRQHGIVHMVSKGARKKGGRVLQPFAKMLLSWSGRGELLTLTGFEYESSHYTRNFRAQVQCFYLHELILKLIPKMSPAPELFQLYEETLLATLKDPQREEVLRHFELALLAIIGHPLQLTFDYKNDALIKARLFYRYDPELGPTRCDHKPQQWNIVSGSLLRGLHAGNLSRTCLPQAKIFLRGLVEYYLHGRPLMTRQLLRVS